MRKTIPMLVAVVLALATAGVTIASRNGNATQYRTTTANDNATSYTIPENGPSENWPSFPEQGQSGNMHGPSDRGFGPAISGGRGFRENTMSGISVSEEFKENVMNIAESDSDVQNLLSAGYENTDIRPIIKTTVQGNGDITMKATGAIVTLRNGENRALVQVDMEAGKVTRIVIEERTVIEK